MCDRAVVALEEVLGDKLPVGVDRGLGATVVLQLIDRDTRRGNKLRQVAQNRGKRRRVRVGVGEDEWPPGADRRRTQRDAPTLEPRLTGRPRGRQQRAV